VSGPGGIALGEPVWHSAGEHELPPDPAWLAPCERQLAATLRFTKRRNDYLLGRFVGKTAVARALGLGEELASLERIEVRNQRTGPERGAPEVYVEGAPAPVEISITDRAGWGICTLGPPGLRVGCDLELVEARSDAFVADYLTAFEQEFVAAGQGEESRRVRANVVWSAKESVLKVLRTGLRRDTRSVEIRISDGPDSHGWRPLNANSVEGRAFAGWWRREGAFLLTVAFEGPTSPPRALVDPPGLLRATPSHAWMCAPSSGFRLVETAG